MAARHVGSLLDVETGQRFAVTTDPGPGASYGKRWCIMFDDTREQLALEMDSLPTVRVFLILPSYLSWTEFRSLSQAELAARLKIDQASVSRALKDLLNRDIVERTGKGPAVKWKLSLKVGWNGNAAAYHAAARNAEKARPPADLAPLNAAEGIDCKIARPQRALTLLRRVQTSETERARN